MPCGSGAAGKASAQGVSLRTAVLRKWNERGTSQGNNTVGTTVPPGWHVVSTVNVRCLVVQGRRGTFVRRGFRFARQFFVNGTSKVRRLERTLSGRQCHRVARCFDSECSFVALWVTGGGGRLLRRGFRFARQFCVNGTSKVRRRGTTLSGRQCHRVARCCDSECSLPCGSGVPRKASAQGVSLRTAVLRKWNEQGTSQGNNTVGTTVPPGGTVVSIVNVRCLVG